MIDANSRAPQKKGATLRGKDPEDRALTKVCRALRHLIDLEETLEEMASFRCSGRRPEGPGAEPGLKEAMERETWSRVSCSAGADISPSGRVGGGPWGCLASISALAAGECWSTPLEERAFMARLYCPISANFRARLML